VFWPRSGRCGQWSTAAARRAVSSPRACWRWRPAAGRAIAFGMGPDAPPQAGGGGRSSRGRREKCGEMLCKLQGLEADYPGQPHVVQQADLREINQLRDRLGLPRVDARLNEIAAAVKAAVEARPKPVPAAMPDHAEAREIYQTYLKKLAELAPHRA